MSVKIREIYEFFNKIAPFNLQCDWDNSGLIIGSMDDEVNKVGFALDATNQVISEAELNGCDLLITHHPVIFNPVKTLESNSPVTAAIKSSIKILSLHTCLDIANGGVNDVLALKLGLQDIKNMTSNGEGVMCRCGKIFECTADEFAYQIKKHLGGPVKYNDCGKQITKVVVCGGSGGEFLYEAAEKGYDAFVTGEIKHHEFLDAQRLGINVFEAGHFETENPIVSEIQKKFSKSFKIKSLVINQENPTRNTEV